MRFADPAWLLLLAVPLALGVRMLRSRRAPPALRIEFPALRFLADAPASRGHRWRLAPRRAPASPALVLLIGALARPQSRRRPGDPASSRGTSCSRSTSPAA